MAQDQGVGLGAQFQIGNSASPEVFTAVGRITNITGPGITRGSVEATTMDAVGGWLEFLPIMKDAGEVTFDMALTTANMAVIMTELAKTAESNYKIVLPAPVTKTWSFKAFCTGFECDIPTQDRMTASISFKISGAPTLT